MRSLLVKNWAEFQHYKNRNPPWIKLHRAIVDDYAFASLKDQTKAHLLMIWILAAASEGKIPDDAKFIASRIGANTPLDLEAIVSAGFLIRDGSAAGDVPRNIDAPAERKPSKINGHAFTPPEWINRETWDAWIKIRPAKARTPESLKAACAKLEKFKASGHDANSIVANSLANGWQGLFPPDQKKGAPAPAISQRPSIECESCKRRVFTWTGHKCDDCFKGNR